MHIVRDSRSLIIVVIMPVTLMLLFGYGVNLDLKGLPDLRLRPGRQPAEPGSAQALPIERVLHVVRVVDRDYSASPARSTTARQMGIVIPVEFLSAFERRRTC
jgi:hypothetical protein